MKRTIFATLVAAPLFAFSSASFAAEPILLTAEQTDSITAGHKRGYDKNCGCWKKHSHKHVTNNTTTTNTVTQSTGPVTIVQIAMFNKGEVTQTATVNNTLTSTIK